MIDTGQIFFSQCHPHPLIHGLKVKVTDLNFDSFKTPLIWINNIRFPRIMPNQLSFNQSNVMSFLNIEYQISLINGKSVITIIESLSHYGHEMS